MGLRFECNFNTLAGVTPYLPDDDPLSRWFRVHEWTVDPGFTGTLLMIMLNVEPTIPVPGTADYGWMRVRAILDNNSRSWKQVWQEKFIGGALTARQTTPRLRIIPLGSGITFTEGQGLMTQALGGSTTVYRWWSCYVVKADAA